MATVFSVEPKTIEGGLVRAIPAQKVIDNEAALAEARRVQASVEVGMLANHIHKKWTYARDSKRQNIEPRMRAAQRQRRGEYDAEKLAAIRQTGGSEVYAHLTSNKCRAAASWIRDLVMGTGADRIWGLDPTPEPDLPPPVVEMVIQSAAEPIAQATLRGEPPDQRMVRELMTRLRDKAKAELLRMARDATDRMELKMEDQLIEGGFYKALDDFIDDLTTYPAAIIKGPFVRVKPKLSWVQTADGNFAPLVQNTLKLEWTRVDPYDAYPSPHSTGIDDGYFIERHELFRQDLLDMIGVEGYHEPSIRLVLEEHGRGGLRDWLNQATDLTTEAAQGLSHTWANPDELIDALQFWGSVQGKLLREWGMSEKDVPDPLGEYHIEAWLINRTVIRAVINPDPLRMKPYFKACYEDVPGQFWGNAVTDLVRDPQDVINAASRAMVNNMAMASGPQVVVNVDRLASGQEITTLTPWQIWQVANDPLATGSQKPLDFFQPKSNVQELAGIHDKFTNMADEYSGIPKYLTGETTGGAGRTASGLSMLIGNAGKGIKQVISNIDNDVFRPMLMMLYRHNMMYAVDPELKGDVQVVARGAAALIAKETAQVRRNEFLAATMNEFDMAILGMNGRAEVLREVVKDLNMNTDRIIPSYEDMLERERQAAMAAAQSQPPGPGQPSNPVNNRQTLQDGTPVTDNFQPPAG